MSLSSTSPDALGVGSRTRVIAHRGASGYLPEHTAAAKTLAYGLGADFIEQDVVASRDGVPVVLHDIFLDDVSDVADRYAGRRRGDGHFYVCDFTRAELAELSLSERRRPGETALRFPGRYPYASPAFRVLALEDEIRLIAGLNASTGRHVGLYPEIKDPDWHAGEGIDLTRLVHEVLERERDIISGPVFVQSFSAAALRRLQDELGSAWPRVQLLDEAGVAALAADPAAIAAIAGYAVGVGLPYTSLIEIDGGGLRAAAIAAAFADNGLRLHPYTLRRDVATPPGSNYEGVLEFLIFELGVDAIFCDFPDDAIRLRDGTLA